MELSYCQPNGCKYTSSVFNIIDTIKFAGDIHQSRLGKTREVMNATIRFPMNHAPYRPLMARKLGIVEALQVLSGYFDPRHSRQVAPNSRYPFVMVHAYGLKIAHQLPGVIDQLMTDPSSRRAVIHIGKPEDGFENEKPCVQAFQFNIRGGQLMTTVWVRSWDVISGLPYDVMVANLVGQTIAQLLKVEPAHTTFMATSMHYYTTDLDRLVGAAGSAVWGPAKWTRIAIDRKFEDLDQVRYWAIDQLNRIDDWSELPSGLLSD